VPDIVPAGEAGVPVQVKVEPVAPVALNTALVFTHTEAADTRVIAGIAGVVATTALKVAERSLGQVTPLYGTLAVTLTCLAPVAAPLTV
jgi:hypothetical protein